MAQAGVTGRSPTRSRSGCSTIHRLRQRLVEDGLEAALARQPPARTKPRKLDGAQEARLVAIACSQAPEGRASWTLRLLADKLVELELVESIGRGNRAADAQKNDLKPWLKEQWVIPPEANAEFVCAMEDVLEVYQRPYDPQRPLVCFDEGTKQLVRGVRDADPGGPRPPGAHRLRVRTQRHGEPVHDVSSRWRAGGRCW